MPVWIRDSSFERDEEVGGVALAARRQVWFRVSATQTAAIMRVSERGQITIPKALRERFGLHHNVEVEFCPTDRGLLIRKKTSVEHPVDRVYGILGNSALGKGVSVDEYIEEIRGR